MMTFNQKKADAFAERMIDILNSGALSLTTSLGHKTGAMAQTGTATSQDIAETAGLNERYVREWLGSMVTGGFVEYDPEKQTYFLPAEHAAFLTRKAEPDNIAVFAQYIPLLGRVEDEIVECFYNGGGVAYEKFPCFHQIMLEDSSQTVVSSLLDAILPLVPDLKKRLMQGIDVLDVGCGKGLAIITLAQAFPNSR